LEGNKPLAEDAASGLFIIEFETAEFPRTEGAD
jgi:hypothetical protein